MAYGTYENMSKPYSQIAAGGNLETWDRWEGARYLLRSADTYRQWGREYVTPAEYRWIDTYTDRSMIASMISPVEVAMIARYESQARICDLGGGDGIVADSMASRLLFQGCETEVVLLDNNFKNLAVAEEAVKTGIYSPLTLVCRDILSNALESASFDFVVSRNVLQYFGKQQQNQFLSEIARLLKLDGVAVLRWPSARQPEVFNQMMAEIVAVITGLKLDEVAENRHYPTISEISNQAEDMGLSVIGYWEDETRLEVRNSAIGFAQRFGLDEARTCEIDGIIRKFAQNDTWGFVREEVGDRQYFRHCYPRLVVQKVGKDIPVPLSSLERWASTRYGL